MSTDGWICAGCGIASPARRRSCPCPTNVVINSDGSQEWKIGDMLSVRLSDDGIRGYVAVDCLPYETKNGVKRAGQCEIPVWRNEAHDGAAMRWRWNGDVEAPTITPSYHCRQCGLHITITGGLESGRVPVPTPI